MDNEKYLFTDRPDATAGQEDASDTAWAEFQRLIDAPPSALAPPLAEPDHHFAPTETLEPRHASAQSRAWTVPELQALAEANDRICPKPAHWMELYQLLVDRSGEGARRPPMPPTEPTAWKTTSGSLKWNCFRDHIAYAASIGVLGEVGDFLARLPQDGWLHADGRNTDSRH